MLTTTYMATRMLTNRELPWPVEEVPLCFIDLRGRFGNPEPVEGEPDRLKRVVKLALSMREKGVPGPIRLRYMRRERRFRPTDGGHRVVAALLLGWHTIPGQVVVYDEDKDLRHFQERTLEATRAARKLKRWINSL